MHNLIRQKNYDGLQLGSPLEIDLILAGNFGEMRSNHFHTGLDIKTLGVEGQKILAVEDGYVSRVRVSPWGYGLAVYIDHPNGLTSVYAHLSKFNPAIDSLVHLHQVKNESWILDDATLEDSVFVKKGELIAWSGNTGGSSAPHLHFELRETGTEHAINPLQFKCYQNKIKDSSPPKVSGIKLYAVDKKGYLIPGKSAYYSCTLSGKKWVVNYNKPVDISSLICENSYLAIGFHVTDKLDGAGNICGVYHSYLMKGDQTLHEQKMEYLNFDQNRFLNTHQDFNEFDKNHRDIHKNFATVINPLPIYPVNNGLISWDKASGDYTYKAYDVHGNLQTINFSLKKESNEKSENPFDNTTDYFFPDSVNTMLRENFQVLMEPATFYEPMQRLFKIDSNSTYLSPKYQFGEYSIPVQKYFDVRIRVSDLPSNFPIYKLGIGLLSDRNYLTFLGGDYVDGWVEASSRNFGQFILLADTIDPVIKPLDFNESKTITKYNNLQLEINDDLSGVFVYKAHLNGKWVVMEYDRRKKRYIIPLDKWSKPLLRTGKNKIRIYAKDGKGNESEAGYTLIY